MSDHTMMSPEQLNTLPPLPTADVPLPNPSQQFDQHRASGQTVDGIPHFETVTKRRKDGYEAVEYVTILTPGDPKASPRHKVTDEIRRKYPEHYAAFRRGMEMAPVGTPLEMWGGVQPAMVSQLKALNIFTIEQLVGVPDSALHQIPMGKTLVNQAKSYLEAKKEVDMVDGQRRETDALREGQRMMEEQIAALQKQNEALMAKLTESVEDDPPKPRRGRPPKVAE